ncbi:hypothetical protein HK096_010034 [Nowakowskiella sp. JEL0078]|nr:hypothetical protein HK096_010034 [Nowakowskiella sp. JEL0078]
MLRIRLNALIFLLQKTNYIQAQDPIPDQLASITSNTNSNSIVKFSESSSISNTQYSIAISDSKSSTLTTDMFTSLYHSTSLSSEPEYTMSVLTSNILFGVIGGVIGISLMGGILIVWKCIKKKRKLQNWRRNRPPRLERQTSNLGTTADKPLMSPPDVTYFPSDISEDFIPSATEHRPGVVQPRSMSPIYSFNDSLEPNNYILPSIQMGSPVILDDPANGFASSQSSKNSSENQKYSSFIHD